MTNKTMIAKAVKVALYSGFAASLAVSAPASFAADEDGADEAETVVVTGSRLKRTDVEGANPVTVIDREQIELSGEISAAELLRNTTFNTTGSFRPQSGSSAQGVSQIDLRGIGASRSLVLVDGRRLTMSPSTGSSQDLNSIPMGAIERIEILTDGASAIYGSDAIGGVVNVITRKDYNGAELSLQKGEPSVPLDGGDREAGSLTFGSSNDTTSILGGVSWNKREIVFQRDFPWTQPQYSIYGNNWTWADFNNSFTAIPGACNAENYQLFPGGDISEDFCGYNYNATNANEASSSNESLFLKATHMINDDWQLYANATIAKNQSFGRYAPIPDSNFFQGFAIDSDSYNNPTNPDAWIYDSNNPNAIPYDPTIGTYIQYDADGNEIGRLTGENRPVHIFHRFAALGNRDNTVDNENVDFLVGASGYYGDVELDFNMRRVRNRSYDYGNGYLAAQIAWNFVNNFNPGYDSNGDFVGESARYGYDIQSPFDNPENVLSGSAITILRVSDFNIDEVAASAAFDIGELDGGAIQMFVGADRREETYSDQYDAQSEAGQVGGSAGNSAGGGRDVNAMYFETLMPFTEEFEVSLAGRYDDYSDYGDDFSPKVSMRYQPMDELTLRASYGEGFRAPTLDILTQKTAFSADSVQDEATCIATNRAPDCEVQINAYRIANPDLESEQSKQYAFGLAYQPTDWFNFTLDYYDIQIDNRITFFSSQNLINREAAGDPIPPGLGITRRQNGSIAEILTGYGNEGDLETNGVDVNARLNFDFEEAGRLASNFQVSWIHDYSVDGGRNLTRDPGVPQWRAALQNVYNISDFTVAWNVNAIGSQYIDVVSVPGDDGVGRSGNWGTWTTHDLQVSYNTPWDGQVSVGAQNVFEKLPRLEGFDGRDYNYYLYNGYGRVVYARYTQTF